MIKSSLMTFAAALALASAQAFGAEAREFLGKPVKDRGGERVGTVHDLIVDVNDARVVYVMIESREGYHTLPIRALGEELRLNMDLSGAIARGQSLDDARFRRASALLGRPVSQADGPQIGTIRNFRFDPDSGQIEHVAVDTVAGAREFPASVLASRELAGAGPRPGRAPEEGASSGFTVQPSPDRRRLHDPAR